MGYAFENTPFELLPEGEQLAIWIMNAAIRDGQLTLSELMWKITGQQEAERERAEHLASIGHPAYAPPVLAVGESKEVTLAGKHYTMTRTQ